MNETTDNSEMPSGERAMEEKDALVSDLRYAASERDNSSRLLCDRAAVALIEAYSEIERLGFIVRPAVEWSASRGDCLHGGQITPHQYDRLAKAEAILQAAVRAFQEQTP